jgi:hypothetical protein
LVNATHFTVVHLIQYEKNVSKVSLIIDQWSRTYFDDHERWLIASLNGAKPLPQAIRGRLISLERHCPAVFPNSSQFTFISLPLTSLRKGSIESSNLEHCK